MRPCRGKWPKFLGANSSGWETWMCPVCKFKTEISKYFTAERTTEEILAKIHENKDKSR